MRLFICLFSLLPAVASFAADAPKDKKPTTFVNVDPSVYPPSAFQGKADEVRPMPKDGGALETIPDRETRDAVFAKIKGLDKHVNTFDELDKDLLLMRAKNHSLAKLKEKYPSIPGELLDQLQKQAKPAKKKK